MKVVIELPGIKAVSRNDTTGHFFHYKERLNEAETWAATFGKAVEHHFTQPVDVLIEAHYRTDGRYKIADAPNIDDKIFTDILIRWVNRTLGTAYVGGKRKKVVKRVERDVWWLEDDSPEYLRYVIKRAVPS